MGTKMKWSIVLVWLFAQLAWSQVQSGSVVFIDFSETEVTIGADSRTTAGNGVHNDNECKISAFGSKFVFAMAGMVKRDDAHWNAHAIAREVWKKESKIDSHSARLMPRVADGWIAAMEPLYGDPEVIRQFRPRVSPGSEPVIANALFAATDGTGNIVVRGVNIDLDLPLFDSTGKIHIIHDDFDLPANSHAGMGHDEIVDEFRHETSPRAKDYMRWFSGRIANEDISRQRAELASKFIELSILLHPKSSELGFPIDVLQLMRTTGVHWVWRKPNCDEN